MSARAPLPELHFENVPFWTGGERGELLITRCRACGRWIHPPLPRCPSCHAAEVAPEPVSGRGRVLTFTVNRHAWFPGQAVPYVPAIVELEEQPGLRVTTRLVEITPEDARIDLPVRVRFEHVEDVWLPLFEVDSESPAPGAGSGGIVLRPFDRLRAQDERRAELAERPSSGRAPGDEGSRRGHEPRRATGSGGIGAAQGTERPSSGRAPGVNGPVAITGIGQSAVGRRLGRSPLSLTVDAALEAIEDAGLAASDIDGVATWPGAAAPSPGFSGVGVWNVKEALGLELSWFSGGGETAGQLGAVFSACAAIAAGLATHVLCFRTVWESTAQTPERRASVVGGGQSRVGGDYQWLVPFGAQSAANWVAMLARRHFHEFGTTREHLAAIVLAERANAAKNPKAVYREPLTREEYFAARPISEPLGLYDCDVPIDGSTAVIVSRRDAARDCRHPPLGIEAIGCALRGRPFWDQFDDLTTMAARDAAAMLWSRTDLKPGDVDVACLYDGFSFLALVWLEALGFCGRGEGGAFVEGGRRIALDGELPLNTNGGQLSAGRLHGYGLLHEACVQLRGAGGERQVAGPPEVVAVGVGGGPLGGCLLLTR